MHEVVSVAGVVRVHRPAHAELEDHAEHKQQRDLRSLLLGGRGCGSEEGTTITGLVEKAFTVTETGIALLQVQKSHQQGDAGADTGNVAG